MQHRTVRGRLYYTQHFSDQPDQTRGTECFYFTEHKDGCRTVRTTSELELPHPKVLRDIVISYDPTGLVHDCHLRVSVEDTLMGTAWYLHKEGKLEMQAWSPSRGRVEQTVDWTDSVVGLVCHPVFNDGYMFRTLDLSQGPHRKQVNVFNVSLDHRGASPPDIVPGTPTMEYVGEETVTVTAGTFDARHFRWILSGSGSSSHPDIDVWVTAQDYVYLKGQIGGTFMSSYELIEYEEIHAQPN